MVGTIQDVLNVFLLTLRLAQGSPWELVFRICTDVDGDPVQKWLDPDIGNSKPLRLKDECTAHEKSYLINHWEDLVVTEARVSVHDDTGNELAWMTFNAECSETTSWFTKEKITDSSYDDLSSIIDPQFEFYTQDGTNFGSMFRTIKGLHSCYLNSTGWLTVATSETGCTDWYTGGQTPKVYYSAAVNKAQIADAEARSLAVWIRYKNVDGPQRNLALSSVDGFLFDGFTTQTFDDNKCLCSFGGATLYRRTLANPVVVGAVSVNLVPVTAGTCTPDDTAVIPKVGVAVEMSGSGSEDTCYVTYPDRYTVTAYCPITVPIQVVNVWTDDNTNTLALCEVEVFPAIKEWTLTTEDWGHNETDYGVTQDVDLAENVTIIPNPERPISEKSYLVGWSVSVRLESPTDNATVYCQVWRHNTTENQLMLVNSTAVEVTETGVQTIKLGAADWMLVEKGDLLGLSTGGPGVVLFNDTQNGTNCVYIKVERGVVLDTGTVHEFTSVMMEDWLYEFEARLIPAQEEETPWMKIVHNETQHCFTAFLDLISCDNDTDTTNPHKSIRWKMDSSGRLINQLTFTCLDVEVHGHDYLPGSSSCYSLAWGIWRLDREDDTGHFRIYNTLLNKCARHNEQCGLHGLTNYYLDQCQTSPAIDSRMMSEESVIHGAQDWGCYSSHSVPWSSANDLTAENSKSVGQPDPDTKQPDIIQQCLTACEQSPVGSHAGIYERGTKCLCTDLPEVYLTLPGSLCDYNCYNHTPIGSCGPDIPVTSQLTYDVKSIKSFYTRANKCFFWPDIWQSNDTICTEVGQDPTRTCPVFCGVGYNFSSSLAGGHSLDQIQASGSFDLECLGNLSWALGQNDVCEKVRCPMPNDIGVHAETEENTYEFQQTFSCSSGYEYVSGNATRTCQADQTWSDDPYNCTAIFCQSPVEGTGRNDTKIYPTSPVIGTPSDTDPFMTTLEHRCLLGYTMDPEGEVVSSVCTQHGNWSMEVPTCNIVDCGEPPSGVNADKEVKNTTYGAAANYTCLYGYYYEMGNLTRYCKSDGLWSGMAADCAEILCPWPDAIDNTQVATNTTHVGSSAKYTCSPGYKPTGAAEFRRECLLNATWMDIGTKIDCTQILCGEPPNITNTVKVQSGLEVGDTTAYTAEVGYEIAVGAVILHCSVDGEWFIANSNDTIDEIVQNLNETVEMVTCEKPPTITDADANYTTRTYGSKATYTCSNGVPHSAESQCLATGLWSDVDIDCEQNCLSPNTTTADLNNLSPGIIVKPSASQEVTVGSTVDLACDTNYTYQSGHPFATCDATNHTWVVADPLLCSEIMCTQSPEHRTTRCAPAFSAPGSSIGSKVTCDCAPSHTFMSGNMMRTCQSPGQWDGEELACKEVTCPRPVDTKNGPIIITDEGLNINATVRFRCLTDYKLVGASETLCLNNGSWDNPVPVCQDIESWTKEKAGGGGETGGGNETTDGEGTTGGPDTGGSESNVTEPVKPYYGGCDPPPDVKNSEVALNVDNGSYSVMYSCKPGYNTSVDEEPTLACKLSQWVGPDFQCIETVTCSLPPAGVRSTLESPSGGDLTPGVTVEYSCEEGYSRKAGDVNRTCLMSGLWSGEPLDCHMRNCTDPPKIYNTTYEIDRYSRGRVAKYRCYPGNLLVSGELTKNCSSDLLWHGADPVCKMDPEKATDETFLDKLEAEIEANLTDRERYLKKMGFKDSDFSETSQSIGGIECVLFGFVFLLVVGLDFPAFRREFKRLRSNVCGEPQQNPDVDAEETTGDADTVQML